MENYITPPHASPGIQLATPASMDWGSPKPITPAQDTHVSPVLIQAKIDISPVINRLQQDLLILTGFNDNSTLHWRPAWFQQGRFARKLWTLHNPPNVVTERLPNEGKGIELFTRRMRRANDPPPQYIKSWEYWARYCDMYGVPHDFLCEEQVQLMRIGLWRSSDGYLCTPPQYPLYPEPSGQGSYVLTPSLYSTHLPRKFQNAVSASLIDSNYDGCVVVNPTGALTVESQEECSRYQYRHRGHRWSCIPWTTEMEKSCRPLTVKLRLWNGTG